jgi:hypothetical protein
MATNILPFESKTLPAYLKNVNKTPALNDELVSSGVGFPVISIKGKTFAVVRGGEREILPNPKDPDSPATAIDVVILKANKGVSKVFYAKKYEEGSDDKPTCYSMEGIAPEPDSLEIQSPKCATCKQNVWGSRITDSGKKGKACADTKRLAVTTPDQLNEPYLIRVPPASLSNLTEYAQFLAKRGVKYNMVVTKISFDPAAATPKLMFKAAGLLDDDGYAAVTESLQLGIVDQIIGAVAAFEEPTTVQPQLAQVTAPAKTDAPAKADAKATAAKAIEQAAAKPANNEAQKPAPAPTKIVEPEVEVDLDNLSFDD